jgi:hypothetical protein
MNPRLLRTLTVAALLAVPGIASAQAKLTPLAGWQWGGTLEFISGDIHINSAASYGGAISVPVRPGYMAEVMYTYQAADVIARPNSGLPDFDLFDLGTHYIQVNGMRYIERPGSKVMPFVVGGLGTTIFDPGKSTFGSFDTQWLFSMSIGGGFLIQTSDRVALRLQSRFLLPVNWASGGLYFGSGGGGFTVSGGSAMPQGDAHLGLTINLGE